jgi:acyl-CoA reductase-like NAD-dependent aldehyde dehydrogenase
MSAPRYENWICGKAVPPSSGVYLPCVDPSTLLQNGEIAASTAVDIALAVDAARAAQPTWAERSGAQRGRILLAVSAAIESHFDELAELERADTGKIAAQIRLELEMSADYFRYYGGIVRTLQGRTIDQGASQLSYTQWRPYGVVGVITPWNLPLNQACRAIAPALAAGNSVVVKPSEFTSRSLIALAGFAEQAGLEPGLLNVVTGTGPDAGQYLASNLHVGKIVFTGSVATGRLVGRAAADRLVPATLELGGKSPLIVFGDADLDRASTAAVTAAAANSGQVCSATARLLVQHGVYETFVATVADKLATLQPVTDFGPIITADQFDRVIHYFDIARAEGARLVTGGTRYASGPGAQGRFVTPTLFADATPAMRIAREEIFGPVLVAMPFVDDRDAIGLANDSEYGLVGAVWTADVSLALRVAHRIEAGQISINGGALTVESPFGGFKNSGHGREKGIEAMYEYARAATISVSLG